MSTLMTMRIPLGSEMMTTVRLTTGGLCSLVGLGMDESEDCKVCVTESLLLLLHGGFSHAEITFTEDEEGLCVRVTGEGERETAYTMPEDEISAALLEALAREIAVEKSEGGTSAVSFRF